MLAIDESCSQSVRIKQQFGLEVRKCNHMMPTVNNNDRKPSVSINDAKSLI